MLTARASQTVRKSEDQNSGIVVATPKKSHARTNYTFEEDTPKAVSRTRSPSPLGRSSTVLRSPCTIGQNDPRLMNPPFLHTLGTLPLPEMLPVQAPSISDSVDEDQWLFPSSDEGKTSLPATLNRSSGTYVPQPLFLCRSSHRVIFPEQGCSWSQSFHNMSCCSGSTRNMRY